MGKLLVCSLFNKQAGVCAAANCALYGVSRSADGSASCPFFERKKEQLERAAKKEEEEK